MCACVCCPPSLAREPSTTWPMPSTTLPSSLPSCDTPLLGLRYIKTNQQKIAINGNIVQEIVQVLTHLAFAILFLIAFLCFLCFLFFLSPFFCCVECERVGEGSAAGFIDGRDRNVAGAGSGGLFDVQHKQSGPCPLAKLLSCHRHVPRGKIKSIFITYILRLS